MTIYSTIFANIIKKPAVAHTTLPESHRTFGAWNILVFCGQGSSYGKVQLLIIIKNSQVYPVPCFLSICAHSAISLVNSNGSGIVMGAGWANKAISFSLMSRDFNKNFEKQNAEEIFMEANSYNIMSFVIKVLVQHI